MKVMLALILLLALASASVTAFTLKQQGDQQRNICVAVNRLDATIETSLKRSLKTIPTLSYYKQHPKEKATVLSQVRQEIASFQPQNCR